MADNNPNILLVEDAPEMLELASVFLESAGFRVNPFGDAISALNYLNDNYNEVDAVLADILMPEMDGYELCKKIKDDDRTTMIPVIFMSSLTDLEEKIKGYSVGADDYVTKPVSFEELNEKIRKILEIREKNKQLKQQVCESSNAALEAMNYSSDLGQILSFYKTSLDTQTYQQLADNIFLVTGYLGLKASILFNVPEGLSCYGDSGEIAPLEISILEMARGKSRFYDFNTRTIVNYPTFSLLVKNMPVERPERYGVLKDTLGSLGDAIEARTQSLIANNLEDKRRNLIKAVQIATEDTGKTMNDVQIEIENAIDIMMEDIEDAFISLGLTEQQEQKIRDIVGDCLQTCHDAFEKGKHLNSLFDNIKQQLNQTLAININQ